ncbi:MAG: hypothetical protein FK733_05355 [Asgard group archaeon]|nr:hypothetical protein [Asgard group archaeon]
MRTTTLAKNSFSKRFTHDIQEKFSNKNWNAIATNLVVIAFLISFGILVRLLLAYYFKLEFLRETSTSIWNRVVQKNPLDIPIGGFDDFSYYYEAWTTAWYDSNWYPYPWVDINIIRDSPLHIYSYTPFFLYILSIFYRPGSHILWLALPLVAADSACAGMVYLILRKLIKGSNSFALSFFGALLMILAPINLIYNGVYWLNPGPMTLFTLIAIYFAIDGKWWQCFFWLAIATMTKQNALFLAYPLFMAMLGSKLTKNSIKRAVTESIMNALLFCFIFVVGSFPWLFITPKYYIYHLAIPGKDLLLDTSVIDPEDLCIQFSVALQSIGISGWFLDIIAFGVNSMLLMIVTASVIAVYLLWSTYKNRLSKLGLIESITIYLILTHLFLPRGTFKFYTTYFIPFIIIALITSVDKLTNKKIFQAIGIIGISLLFFGSNIWLLIVERIYFPLIPFGICLIIGLLYIGRIIVNRINKNQFLEKVNKNPF